MLAKETAPTVYIVDDDAEVLKALGRLVASVNLNVAAFSSAQSFLAAFDPAAPACLVLDLAMPGASGLELQRTLETRARGLPIVFLTGHGDIGSSVQAMKRGASDFLTKPVDEDVLMAAVRGALERRREREHENAERGQIEERLATLTPRERQVLDGIVAGLLNKQIAGNLLTTEKTVKFHRANLMRKMGVTTVAGLVKAAERGGIGKAPSH